MRTAVIVGAGAGISDAWYPPLIEEKVEIVAAVDIRKESAQAQVDKYKLKSYVSDNLDETLTKYKPDFVLDLTTPNAHCEVTCKALRAGCHVIGEKPMASSLEEARLMVKTAEETGKMYMVSQSRRWNETHEKTAQTIKSGGIGEITTINCDFYRGVHFGDFRDLMDSPLILDMSIHHFDLVRFMSGAEPISVYAIEFNPKGSWYKGDAAASAIFEMSNGVVFTYRASWCAEGCETSWNGDWRFIGEKGTLIYEKDNEPFGEIVIPNGESSYDKQPIKIAESNLSKTLMHGALLEMLDYLDTGKIPQTECHDNIKSIAMVYAVLESAQKEIQVKIEY